MTNIPVVLSLVHSKTDYSVFLTSNTDVSPFSCIATYVRICQPITSYHFNTISGANYSNYMHCQLLHALIKFQ